MDIFAIMIAPEAEIPFLYPEAFRTREDAEQGIKDLFVTAQPRADGSWKDADYTFYYIQILEVNFL